MILVEVNKEKRQKSYTEGFKFFTVYTENLWTQCKINLVNGDLRRKGTRNFLYPSISQPEGTRNPRTPFPKDCNQLPKTFFKPNLRE